MENPRKIVKTYIRLILKTILFYWSDQSEKFCRVYIETKKNHNIKLIFDFKNLKIFKFRMCNNDENVVFPFFTAM